MLSPALLILLSFRGNELSIKAGPNKWAEKDAAKTILPEAITNFNSLHKGLSLSIPLSFSLQS